MNFEWKYLHFARWIRQVAGDAMSQPNGEEKEEIGCIGWNDDWNLWRG